MIEREILKIVEDRVEEGERLNEIVNQFRRGRNVEHVVALLDSGDAKLVSVGAWILGELPFGLYSGERIVSRLRRLTSHLDAAVRFNALGALYPALDPADASAQEILQKLLHDPNDGVRKAAEAAAARLAAV